MWADFLIIVSVLHQNEGGIGKSIPDAREIFRDTFLAFENFRPRWSYSDGIGENATKLPHDNSTQF